ncbi:MAG: sugar transferase [Clostridiales bacterium]
MLNRIVALIGIIFLSPLLFIIAISILVEDGFPIFFRQKRIGRDNSIFILYKFRSMKKNTPDVATHLLNSPEKYLLKIGKVLRKLSLDELPNFINILKGDMNFVGPRPALFNQYDLMELRTRAGVHILKPGLTGWAQVNGRDEISIPEKVKLDAWYKENYSLKLDLKILSKTVLNSILSKNVSH